MLEAESRSQRSLKDQKAFHLVVIPETSFVAESTKSPNFWTFSVKGHDHWQVPQVFNSSRAVSAESVVLEVQLVSFGTKFFDSAFELSQS